ncbi:MAG TPA: zinc-dependent peptidase [Pirellulaceae bacterium]|nr:zinc-dependent peptidase [Pirellulaceae bacterium]
MFSFFARRRRQKLLRQPLPAAWREILERNVAVYSRLSSVERSRLEAALQVIASERRFVGCGGLVITDEVKVTIAAQAALLLLGEEGYYFDRVPTIFVFPRPRADKVGRNVQHGSAFSAGAHVVEEGVIVEGQAYAQGEIRLAWSEVLAGGRDAGDGENVVLHELAHHLDGLDGEMGGTPPLPDEAARIHWQQVFDAELVQLRRDLATDRPALFHDAAADSRTELFAYATEVFFEQPIELGEEHAELFECLRDFYKVDPTRWFAAQPADAPFTRPFEAAVPRVPLPSEDDDWEEQEEPAAELPPLETADQYFTRGLESFEREDFEAAEADFDRAVKLAPQDQEAVLYRGRARMYLSDTQAALADAERACRLAPDDLEAIALRGICQVALGEFAEGLADLENAADALDGDLDLLYSLGVARAETGQTAAAIAAFTRLIQLDPKDAEAWHERSQCHAELGDKSAAERDLAQARALGWEEGQKDGETE